MDYQLSPGLAVSFGRALERHVKAPGVRIIEAVIAPKTMLNQQHVRTSMLVEANGRTYRLRHDWETDKPVPGVLGTRNASHRSWTRWRKAGGRLDSA